MSSSYSSLLSLSPQADLAVDDDLAAVSSYLSFYGDVAEDEGEHCRQTAFFDASLHVQAGADYYCLSGGAETGSNCVGEEGAAGDQILPDAPVLAGHGKTDEDSTNGGGSGGRSLPRSKIAFKTRSDVDVLDDGYRWRKYGKKMVKDSPNPRNYYRCSREGCHVKKRVERHRDDARFVITTYDGVHNHPASPPPPPPPQPSRACRLGQP